MKNTILILIVPLLAFSQIKIGTIEITEKLAGEYFLDCYKNTEEITQFADGSFEYRDGNSIWVSKGNNILRQKRDAAVSCTTIFKNDTIDGFASTTWYTIYYIPRQPSERDFIKWFKERTSKK